MIKAILRVKQVSGNLRVRLAFFVAAVCGVVMNVGAVNFWDWTGVASDGRWSTQGNWSEGTHSTPLNGARFLSLAGPYTINLDGAFTAGDFRVATDTTDETEMARPLLVGGELDVSRHFAVGTSSSDISYNKQGPSLYPTWQGSSSASLCVNGSSIKIGSPEKRGGFFAVGSGVTMQAGTSCGMLSMTGGVFQAYVDNVYVGYMAANNNSAKGIVRFDASTNGIIDVKSSIRIGSTYSNTRTAELVLGTNWTIRLGSKESPGVILGICDYLRYGADFTANGLLTMSGGSFEAYVSKIILSDLNDDRRSTNIAKLRLEGLTNVVLVATDSVVLGRTSQSIDGTITNIAEIDAATCSNVTFETPSLTLSQTFLSSQRTTHGVLRLGRGSGLVGDLSLGNVAGTAITRQYGLIELKGFQMTLTNAVTVAGCGIVSNDVNGVSSGFALNETAMLAQSDGKMYVTFSRDPEGMFKPVSPERAEGCYWGFKWAGDHVDDVQSLIDGGKLVVDTTGLSARFLAKYSLYYSEKEDTTYLGVPFCSTSSKTTSGFIFAVE